MFAPTLLIIFVYFVANVHGEYTFEEQQYRLLRLVHLREQQRSTMYSVIQQLQDFNIYTGKVFAAFENVVEELQSYTKNWHMTQASNIHKVFDEKFTKSGLTFTSEEKSENGSFFPSQCLEDTVAYMDNFKKRTTWALQMADSTGKPGPGVLKSRLMFVGDFDECNSVIASYNRSEGNGLARFRGRYCSGNFHLSFDNASSFENQLWGFCLPNSCSNDDVLKLSSIIIRLLNVTLLTFTKFECYEPIRISKSTIGLICLIALFVGLVFVSSILDVVLIQRAKWRTDAINSLTEEEEREIRTDLGNHPEDGDCYSIKFLSDQRSSSDENSSSAKFRLLRAISAWTNNQNLLRTRQRAETLKCINGIRVISITWVILGHTVIIMCMVTENVATWAETHFARWTFQVIRNGVFSVDTFFTLSGILVAYLSLNEMKQQNGKLNWVLFYLHRYIRLTPVYMICLVILIIMAPLCDKGPLHLMQEFRPPICQSNWWANLLYVQNLIRFQQPCFGWGWYLALDMQFYVVSPAIFWPLYHKPVLGFVSSVLFFLATTITPYVLSLTQGYGLGIGDALDEDRIYFQYVSPYCRMGPYIVGLLLGYILHRCRGKHIKLHWVINILGWMLATALALIVLIGLFDYANGKEPSLQLSAFYNALSRPAWGLCIAWVIFSCVTGNAGPVNALLSWAGWIPLSRLTYTAYLTHPIVLLVWATSRRTSFFFTDVSVVMVFFATLLATFAVSYIIFLFFEAPVMAVEKMLFKREKRSY